LFFSIFFHHVSCHIIYICPPHIIPSSSPPVPSRSSSHPIQVVSHSSHPGSLILFCPGCLLLSQPSSLTVSPKSKPSVEKRGEGSRIKKTFLGDQARLPVQGHPHKKQNYKKISVHNQFLMPWLLVTFFITQKCVVLIYAVHEPITVQSLHEPRKASSSFWAGENPSSNHHKGMQVQPIKWNTSTLSVPQSFLPRLPSLRPTFNQVKPLKPSPELYESKGWSSLSTSRTLSPPLDALVMARYKKGCKLCATCRTTLPEEYRSFAAFHPILSYQYHSSQSTLQTSHLLKSSPRSGWINGHQSLRFLMAGRAQACFKFLIKEQEAAIAWDLSEWGTSGRIISSHCHPDSWAHTMGSTKIFPYHQDIQWGHQNNQGED